MYEVTVGNVGNVYTGASKAEALRTFKEYVRQSKSGRGRAAHEDVTLWHDSVGGHFEPIQEYSAPHFAKGERVQLHPGTDRWMMGDRYGVVTGHIKGKIRVKLDKSGKSLLFYNKDVCDLDGYSRGED